MKEYAIIGYIENDESRPNMEVFKFLSAETDEEAAKQFDEYEPNAEDFLTGEELEVVKTRVVEIREVKICED